jgi:hypothetical protein
VAQQALDAARSIGEELYRPRALWELAPHLPADLLREALDAARSIVNNGYRSAALAALAPRLPAELLRQALDAARSIGDEGDRYQALAALAPHLPAELLSEALDAARSFGKEWARSKALAALAPRLADPPLRDLSAAWAQTLQILADRTRSNLLADLCSLAPILVALAQPDAAAEFREVARAIADVARWWP